LHQQLHVDPGIALLGRVAQQVGRVIGYKHSAVAPRVKAASQAPQGLRGFQQGRGGNGSQATDELGLMISNCRWKTDGS
jgi:hypothetical protein